MELALVTHAKRHGHDACGDRPVQVPGDGAATQHEWGVPQAHLRHPVVRATRHLEDRHGRTRT